MQQDNNNIENKLRQLEDQQLPDLSHMDEHWQKMQAILQPNVPVSKLRVNNQGKLIGGAIGLAIITLLYVGYQKFSIKKIDKESPVTTATIIPKIPSLSDTIVTASTVIPIKKIEISQGTNKNIITLPFTDMGNGVAADFVDTLAATDKTPGNKLNRVSLLDQLKDQFVKVPQQFIINNTKDTLLTAAEGTTILIPVNSLGGGTEVEVRLTEYYKRSDIIENWLSTTSNDAQLVTGGMIHVTATYKGNEVKINNNIPLTLFMPDTSSINMTGMELFNGDKTGNAINWIPQGRNFSRTQLVTEVRVLNITDQPYKTKQKRKGEIGYFITGDSLKISKAALKRMLKEKYGYYKIKLRSNIKNLFKVDNGNRAFEHQYGENIGDSMWVEKGYADKYKLQGTATRQILRKNGNGLGDNGITNALQNKLNGGMVLPGNDQSSAIIKNIQEKYHLNITQLGWINCDRFYSDSRKKISYYTDLGDDAQNYYTMLVFDNINSMIAGEYNGSKVVFKNIPVGEPVKIISIGINKEGEKVYSVTAAITGEQEVKGIKYELASNADIKKSLVKLDQ
ncbi:hypothetical protein LK994_02190 [Ferruginibacter lapsinanis]|uniref:hypothetical protein n=1 Tax=Ferruginibacter lapsinanis TaxID=563172 RepID=UPI001E46C2DB|nr:hypothetical protein [Ferruginibacter lapsinanis]UEG50283.1 hypothetical protein LK994_02190 [Ferruginibacter lapsinanis]